MPSRAIIPPLLKPNVVDLIARIRSLQDPGDAKELSVLKEQLKQESLKKNTLLKT